MDQAHPAGQCFFGKNAREVERFYHTARRQTPIKTGLRITTGETCDAERGAGAIGTANQQVIGSVGLRNHRFRVNEPARLEVAPVVKPQVRDGTERVCRELPRIGIDEHRSSIAPRRVAR